MGLCTGGILVIFLSVCVTSDVKIMKYSSLPPGKITKPAEDVIQSLQVKAEEDCLIQCHGSASCISYEVSSSNGQYSCTLRGLFSEDPVNQIDNPGVISYFLGKQSTHKSLL